MSTDLEQRLHDELRDRARDAGPLRAGGSTVRQAAAVRRGRRLRAGAVGVSAVLVAAVVTGVVTVAGNGRPEDLPPAQPTGSPTSSATGLIRVAVSPDVLEQSYLLMGAGRPELLAATRLPRSGDTVLAFDSESPSSDHRTVVYTVTVHDGEPTAGTLAFYQPWDELVAQPARDGDGSTLLVVAPATSGADSIEVTTSLPGKDISVRRVALDGRLTLVPLPSPQAATRLRLLRGDAPLDDRIAGDFHLPGSVPRPLARVVVATDGAAQAVQVRTDGITACRMTVGGLSTPDAFVQEWNPFDDACTRIAPAGLRLLIAADRRYSSVAGVAPRGADVVRLHWRNGDVTDVPVARDEVPAFIDTSGHRPDRLVLAEALDRSGTVMAEARP